MPSNESLPPLGMRFVSLFAGIGGLDLGLERAGHECVLQVEINPFCREVLAKHWPDVRRIADVRDVTAADCAGADLVVGGFPCQPVSTSGRRKGVDDERWLWPEFRRVVECGQPRWVLIENVVGLVTLGLREVAGDLRELGYVVPRPRIIAACQMGAPHTRERLFVIAYAASLGQQRPWDGWEDASYHTTPIDWEADRTLDAVRRGTLPIVCREDHGVPRRLDRLTALGNAVVPQVAELVGRQLRRTA